MKDRNIIRINDSTKPYINEILFSSISTLINRLDNKEITIDRRIAVFDLDNTLLIGDIADAAMAHLIENEIEIDFSWQEYQQLIKEENIYEAFSRTSKILSGMETECVERLANVIFDMSNEFITFFEDDKIIKVAVPRPNPIMQKLIKYLYENNFEIFVISASNQWLVKAACERFFHIPFTNVFGVKNKTNLIDCMQILTDVIEVLAPIDKNKGKIYLENISLTPPMISAGDSIYDTSMLNLTNPDGIILWLGDDNTLSKIFKIS